MKVWEIENPAVPNFEVEWKYNDEEDWKELTKENFTLLIAPYIGKCCWKSVETVIEISKSGAEINTLTHKIRRRK